MTTQSNDHIKLTSSQLSVLIGEVYEAALTGDWSQVLDLIIHATQSNKAFLFLQKVSDPKPLLLEFKTNFDYPAEVLNDYQNRTFEDPFYQISKNATEGETLNLNAQLDIIQYKGTYFYDNIIEPMRSHQVLAGILIRDGEHESLFVINRSLSDPDYDQQDLNLIQLLTPHMMRAIQTFKVLQLYKDYTNIVKSILDQTDKGIIVCDREGTILLSNKFANENLASCAVLDLTSGKILLTEQADNKRLKNYIKQCSVLAFKGIGVQESIFIDTSEHEMVVISVSPLKHKKNSSEFEQACCFVTITLQQTLNWNIFSKEYGLTNRESQLVQAIYSKKKLNDLIGVFNISYNTLRTHLQSVFRKVEVNSQTELMIKINMFKN